jgi:nitrogen fixation NifU-like protein
MNGDELYRELVMEHWRQPRFRGHVPHPDLVAEGANPLCGDEITLTLALEDGRIADIRFEGHGCTISQASASMLTEAVRGRSLAEAQKLAEQFKRWMTGREQNCLPEALDELEALEGVKRLPLRVKCAVLAWEALLHAEQASS